MHLAKGLGSTNRCRSITDDQNLHDRADLSPFLRGSSGNLAKDGDGVGIVKQGGLTGQIPDVAAIDKDADVGAKTTAIEHMGPKIRVGGHKALQDISHRGSF
jgi:hypothetical protein